MSLCCWGVHGYLLLVPAAEGHAARTPGAALSEGGISFCFFMKANHVVSSE